MKTINLAQETADLEQLLNLARKEPVLLLTSEGEEFCLAEADNFDQEVEALRKSPVFQKFLNERSQDKRIISLEELEEELNEELAKQENSPNKALQPTG